MTVKQPRWAPLPLCGEGLGGHDPVAPKDRLIHTSRSSVGTPTPPRKGEGSDRVRFTIIASHRDSNSIPEKPIHHYADLANRSEFCAEEINRTPEPAPCGSFSSPFVTSSPSNGSSSNRSNSPNSQA